MQHIALITLNLWNTEHWDRRKACVVSFVQTYYADVYCFQEVRPKTLAVIDEALPDYIRIEGPERGWRYESAIYVKSNLLTVEEYGLVDLAMVETDRGLFWARLRTKKGKQLFVSTIHLTHQQNEEELATGVTMRFGQAHRAAQALNALIGGEAALLCGDFNDPVLPSLIFEDRAAFKDVFTALGVTSPVTFPCPYLSPEGYLVESIDKIMFKGPIRPVLAASPRYMTVGEVLSDHWPVAAVFALT